MHLELVLSQEFLSFCSFFKQTQSILVSPLGLQKFGKDHKVVCGLYSLPFTCLTARIRFLCYYQFVILFLPLKYVTPGSGRH